MSPHNLAIVCTLTLQTDVMKTLTHHPLLWCYVLWKPSTATATDIFISWDRCWGRRLWKGGAKTLTTLLCSVTAVVSSCQRMAIKRCWWVQQKMLHNKSDITCWTNIYCILSTRLLALAGPGLQLGGAQAAAVLTVGRVRAGGQSNRHPRAIKEAVNLCKIVKYAFSGNLVIINLIFS